MPFGSISFSRFPVHRAASFPSGDNQDLTADSWTSERMWELKIWYGLPEFLYRITYLDDLDRIKSGRFIKYNNLGFPSSAWVTYDSLHSLLKAWNQPAWLRQSWRSPLHLPLQLRPFNLCRANEFQIFRGVSFIERRLFRKAYLWVFAFQVLQDIVYVIITFLADGHPAMSSLVVDFPAYVWLPGPKSCTCPCQFL